MGNLKVGTLWVVSEVWAQPLYMRFTYDYTKLAEVEDAERTVSEWGRDGYVFDGSFSDGKTHTLVYRFADAFDYAVIEAETAAEAWQEYDRLTSDGKASL